MFIIFISFYFPFSFPFCFFVRCACMLRVQAHLSVCEHTWLFALGALCACACDIDVFFLLLFWFCFVARLFFIYFHLFLFLIFVHVRAVRVCFAYERTCLRPSIRACSDPVCACCVPARVVLV